MARFMRGQAAMEYLVTYGWALLALFAVVAILVSTGAFSSANFSQQECTFQPGLPCSPFIIYLDAGATTMKFTVINDLGFPIEIVNASVTATDIGQSGRNDYQIPQDSLPQGVIGQSKRMDFSYTFEGQHQPQSRSFESIIAVVSYLNCKGVESDCNVLTAPTYTTSGRISSVVEQGTSP